MANTTAKWYALYTRPRWEKKVSEILKRKGVEYYCPLNKVQKQWSDRKKIVEEPLFTSYVFVRLCVSDILTVKQTDGVINFVYWLGQPAVIRDEEILAIQQFLLEYSNVKLERTDVAVNDVVRITSGPLMYREGNVVEVLKKTVKVVLPSLGFALVAQVDKANITKITGEAKTFSSDVLNHTN